MREYDNLLKVVLLGGTGEVGKSCLLDRFCNGHFSNCDLIWEANFNSKIISRRDGKKIKLNIRDVNGPRRFSVYEHYYKDTDIGIICFDITNRDSFDRVQFAYETWIKTPQDGKRLIIAGLKSDLVYERQVSREEALALCKQIGIPEEKYFECSAKTGEGVNELFIGAANLALEIENKLRADEEYVKIPNEFNFGAYHLFKRSKFISSVRQLFSNSPSAQWELFYNYNEHKKEYVDKDGEILIPMLIPVFERKKTIDISKVDGLETALEAFQHDYIKRRKLSECRTKVEEAIRSYSYRSSLTANLAAKPKNTNLKVRTKSRPIENDLFAAYEIPDCPRNLQTSDASTKTTKLRNLEKPLNLSSQITPATVNDLIFSRPLLTSFGLPEDTSSLAARDHGNSSFWNYYPFIQPMSSGTSALKPERLSEASLLTASAAAPTIPLPENNSINILSGPSLSSGIAKDFTVSLPAASLSRGPKVSAGPAAAAAADLPMPPGASGKPSFNVIAYQDLTFGKELGRGGFGIVYQGKYPYGEVAIKQLNNSRLPEDVLSEFQREVHIMARLQSPHVVPLYGACFEAPHYALVMEYLPKGSLYQLLGSKEDIAWNVRYQIGVDVSRGLAYLHKQGIIHGDIKSLNVLLDNNYRAKLCDFGLAKVKIASSPSIVVGGGAGGGSTRWMAPELFKRGAKKAKASDVYSYAVVLWELGARKMPFAEDDDSQVIGFVVQGERETVTADTPPKMAALIAHCWNGRAEVRPTMDEAVKELQEEQAHDPRLKRGSFEKKVGSNSSDLYPAAVADTQPQHGNENWAVLTKPLSMPVKRYSLSLTETTSHARVFAAYLQRYQLMAGMAQGAGDCFYDACAQLLNVLLNTQEYTVKSLRLLCYSYVQELDRQTQGDNWISKCFRKQNEAGQWVRDGDKYHQYLANVQYTAEEKARGMGIGDREAIWGEPHIDGRILCKKLGTIKLHVIDINVAEGDLAACLTHRLIDGTSTKAIEGNEIIFQETNVVHLIVDGKHFVPVYLMRLQARFDHLANSSTLPVNPRHSSEGASNNPTNMPVPSSLSENWTALNNYPLEMQKSLKR